MKAPWRRSGKEQTAKCPVCGKYMEKEEAIALPTADIAFTDVLHAAYHATFWICRECNQEGKA